MPIEIQPDQSERRRDSGISLRNQLRLVLAPGLALSVAGLPIGAQARDVLEYLYGGERGEPHQQHERAPSPDILRELVERFGVAPHVARHLEKWHRVCPEYMVTVAIMAMAGETLETACLALQVD